MTLSSAQIEDAIKHNQVHGDRAIGEADKAVSLAPTLLLDAIDVLGQLGQIA